jgi:hypothetical protein
MTDKELRNFANKPDSCVMLTSAQVEAALRTLHRKNRPLEYSLNLAAEWLKRLWLRQDKHNRLLQELDILPQVKFDEFCDLFTWRINTAGALQSLKTHKFFNCEDARYKKLCIKVYNLLKALLIADGVIPLLNQNEGAGCCLFFTIEPHREAAVIVLTEENGEQKHEEWSKYILEIQQPLAKKYHVKIAGGNVKLNGCSLQLPVLLAIWRKETCLPQYNIFDLVATGCFDDGKLEAVAGLVDKGNWLKNELGTKAFVFPANSDEDSDGIRLRPGLNFDEVKEKISEIIVEHGLATLHKDFCIRQVKMLDGKIRDGFVTDWHAVLRHLESIEKHFDPAPGLDNEYYIKVNALISAVLCHCGRADEAAKHNKFIRKKVKEANNDQLYWRMMIESIVVNTDLENWDDALAVSCEIPANIKGKNDLLMRYHGSIGQVLAFKSLRDSNIKNIKASLEHFNLAIQFAQQLIQELTPEKKEEKQHELGRDFNYRHLFYALFEPGSDDELEYYRKAEEFHHRSENREFNLAYLARQRNLAAYRNLLINGIKLSHAQIKALPTNNTSEDWITATILKYQGALYAAAGDHATATEYFDRAIKLLENAAGSVIRGIGMTIAAEAKRSLHRDEYRQYISNYFAEYGDRPFAGHSKAEWLDKNNIKPLLSYQY